MKTAFFINTFAKMANYDLQHLSSFKSKNIAIVHGSEYLKFKETYEQYFSHIFPSPLTNDDIPYSFAKEIISSEITQHSDNSRIICLSEDNLLLAAQLRDEFKIPGMSLAETLPFRDKVLMKDALRGKNIRLPLYCSFDKSCSNIALYFESLKGRLGLPFVLKPTRLLGGLGVTIIDSLLSFETFIKNTSKNTEYEAEEFISGTLFHCDSIRKENKTIYAVCCEYTNPNLDFQNGRSVISMLLQDDDPLVQRIIAFNEEVLTALNFKQGISHHEIFLTPNDELVFLEIAARSPGAVVTPMYSRALGIGLEDIDFKLQMDIPFDVNNLYRRNYLSGIFPVMPGKVIALLEPPISSEYEMKWYIDQGQTIHASKSLRDKSACIFAWNKDKAELRKDFELLKYFQSVMVI